LPFNFWKLISALITNHNQNLSQDYSNHSVQAMSHYRTKRKATFQDKFYNNIAPIVTGVGASVVIVGALFKIQHWPGSGPLLIAGLGTEALLFLLFAFAPQHADPDWSIVYKELDPEYEGDFGVNPAEDGAKNSVVKRLEDMLEKAKVDQSLVEKLGRGMNTLAESASKMSELGNAAVATAEYSKNTKATADAMANMNKSLSATATAMGDIATSSAATANDSKAYHAQVQVVTKNLTALNMVYENELKDTNSHIKAMNKFMGNMSTAMDSMASAAADTQAFKAEMSKLNKNLTSLNSVYGNMLSAMRG
jgi:gliding motility-associated protein GldL